MSVSRDFIDCYSPEATGNAAPDGTDYGTDNVSVRFPVPPQFEPTGDILPPSWLLLPYFGPKTPRAACAAGWPRRLRGWSRPGRPQAGRVPPYHHKSPLPAGPGSGPANRPGRPPAAWSATPI